LFAPPELDLLSFDHLASRLKGSAVQEAAFTEGATIALKQCLDLETAEAEAEMALLEGKGITTQEFYRLLQTHTNGRLLVEKSPGYALKPAILQRIETGFQAPLYIHLTRHPYGMIRSYEEARLDLLLSADLRERFPLSRRQLAELTWLISERNLATFFEGIEADRVLLVRFEDILADPESTLRRICSFLGVAFQSEMLEPYREKQRRMTEGLHPQSRMIGDVKFHEHKDISSETAEQWRKSYRTDFLSEPTAMLAARLGYPLIADEATAMSQIPTSAGTDLGQSNDAMLDGLVEADLASLSEAELDALLVHAMNEGEFDHD